jgi:hypothetical protein
MLFVAGKPEKLEAPMPLNREVVNHFLDEHYPEAFRRRGVGGAVAVELTIDDRGVVRRAVARKPRFLGMIPRKKPKVYHPGTGEALSDLPWSEEPEFLEIAERAASIACFFPATRNGIAEASYTYRIVCLFVPDITFRQDPHPLGTCMLTG